MRTTSEAWLWALDHLARWSERIGDLLSGPFFRISRWAADRWFKERRDA